MVCLFILVVVVVWVIVVVVCVGVGLVLFLYCLFMSIWGFVVVMMWLNGWCCGVLLMFFDGIGLVVGVVIVFFYIVCFFFC